MQYVEPIARLIRNFSRLPGIGEKTAARLALFVLNSERTYVAELSASLTGVKDDVSLCSECMSFSDIEPCPICADPARDRATICVVSDFKDMAALESTGRYRGLYHILHGSLAPLKGIGPDRIKIKELVERLGRGTFSEVVVATGFDAEGEATAAYLSSVLAPLDVKLSRIASGVPVGSFIEYMDSSTLERAMEGRREL